jgi:hypothetical protein
VLIAGVVAFGSPSAAPRPQATPYSDPNVALAAGYELQTATGPVEHWVNPAYFDDGHEEDPARPEALMYVRTPTGLQLEALVFVRERASDAASVADAGPWHTHSSCLGPGGLGVPLPGGPCPPGTALEETAPMLHVWMNASSAYCQLTP